MGIPDRTPLGKKKVWIEYDDSIDHIVFSARQSLPMHT